MTIALLAALAGTWLLAGCGAGSSSSSTTGSSGAGGAAASLSVSSAKAVKYAHCVRTHGVLSFPDPNAQGRFALAPGVTNSPSYAAAQRACRSLQPPGVESGSAPTAKQLTQVVAFAACMRKHGVLNFPDDLATARAEVKSGQLSLNSPQFQAAAQSCRSLLLP